jgi:uncharacterized protein (UPF0297 family)
MINKIIIIVTSLCFVVSAQAINIMGTVTNAVSGAPLQGVSVTIKNYPQVSATTAQDGSYVLYLASGTIQSRTEETPFSGSRLNNGVLEIGVTTSELIQVEKYALNGALRARIINKVMAPGLYKYDIGNIAQISLIKVRQGDKTSIFSSLFMRSSGTSIIRSSSTSNTAMEKSLSKTVAISDTLIFTLAGFTTAKIGITSYSGLNNVALQPLVTNIVTASGNCSAVSYATGVFSLTFTITNTGNVPIEIMPTSSYDIRGSANTVVTATSPTSTLVTGYFIPVGQTYTYTISGGCAYIPEYYDAITYYSDGNGHSGSISWSDDAITAVAASGSCSAISSSVTGAYSLAFTVKNTGNVPIEIMPTSSYDIRGSANTVITTTNTTSTLVTGYFIPVGQTYTYTLTGVCTYIPEYYDATTYYSDGNGHTASIAWSDDAITVYSSTLAKRLLIAQNGTPTSQSVHYENSQFTK